MLFIFKNYLIAKIIIIVLLGFFLGLIIYSLQKPSEKNIVSPKKVERNWQIKSVDTMKFSRDLSQEMLKEQSFDEEIEAQIIAIRGLNSTHVAIGTPYDEKLIPMLTRWVKAARKHNLRVWFRGNFSGWEGWFGEKRNSITREEHTQLTRDLIRNNPDLFENGDIFSSCPECENGGPGDPRSSGDVEGHRNFLVSERNAALEEFQKIGKKITVLDSMNYDVARLVMNKDTAQAMGGIVAIDHYVLSPVKLAQDIDNLHNLTGANIFLGEFGVPIPDIHGQFSDKDQSAWVEEALNLISKKQFVIGLNYWVAIGGSTAIFDEQYNPKPAAESLKKYFSLLNLDLFEETSSL